MSEKIDLLKEIAKTNKYTSKMYAKIKSKRHKSDFSISSLNYPIPYKDSKEKLRINIVVPGFKKSIVYAGLTTAINAFIKLCDGVECDRRIIVMSNEKYHEKLTYGVNGFEHNNEKDGIFFLRENPRISIRKNEIFVMTSWHTVYIVDRIYKWQRDMYGETKYKKVYFIQDYEPGFSPWSTEYMLAEATYKLEKESTVAVFNSEELYRYFKLMNYSFSCEVFFKPSLNEKLREYLYDSKSTNIKRNKIILVYGRISSYRNCFGLLIDALRIFSAQYKKAKEWRIISLGEIHDNIKLENNEVISYGKVSLKEYAHYMCEAYLGVSLMASPHPSYPPLEMSTFGMKVITNNFLNKDLSYFNDNINVVDNCSPYELASKMIDICEQYYISPSSDIVINEAYVEGASFDNAIDIIKKELFM